MYEGDSPTAGADARCFVDQLVAGLLAGSQGGVQIADPIADMVDSRPATGQEPGDWTFRFSRGKELDLRIAERERNDGSSVSRFGGMRLEGQHVAVERECRVEIGHGNPNMRNPGAIRHAILPVILNRSGINL